MSIFHNVLRQNVLRYNIKRVNNLLVSLKVSLKISQEFLIFVISYVNTFWYRMFRRIDIGKKTCVIPFKKINWIFVCSVRILLQKKEINHVKLCHFWNHPTFIWNIFCQNHYLCSNRNVPFTWLTMYDSGSSFPLIVSRLQTFVRLSDTERNKHA